MLDATDITVNKNILTLTLDRPEKKNAINDCMSNEIIYALKYANQNDSVRVVVIQANGDTFCAGADLAKPCSNRSFVKNQLSRVDRSTLKPGGHETHEPLSLQRNSASQCESYRLGFCDLTLSFHSNLPLVSVQVAPGLKEVIASILSISIGIMLLPPLKQLENVNYHFLLLWD